MRDWKFALFLIAGALLVLAIRRTLRDRVRSWLARPGSGKQVRLIEDPVAEWTSDPAASEAIGVLRASGFEPSGGFLAEGLDCEALLLLLHPRFPRIAAVLGWMDDGGFWIDLIRRSAPRGSLAVGDSLASGLLLPPSIHHRLVLPGAGIAERIARLEGPEEDLGANWDGPGDFCNWLESEAQAAADWPDNAADPGAVVEIARACVVAAGIQPGSDATAAAVSTEFDPLGFVWYLEELFNPGDPLVQRWEALAARATPEEIWSACCADLGLSTQESGETSEPVPARIYLVRKPR